MTALTRTYVHSDMRVATRNDVTRYAFDIKSLQLTFDKSWSPYGQGTLTCGQLPAATIAAMEPRNGMRLRWRTTQTNYDGSSFFRDFDLNLRSRSQDWATNELTLTAATDEALMQDYGYTSAQTYTGAPVNPGSGTYFAADIAERALTDALPVGFDIVLGVTPQFLVENTAANSDVGTTSWDWASSLAELAGAWLFVDEKAKPQWAVADYSPAGFDLTLGDDDDIIGVADTVSRDDPAWATAVVLAYTADVPTTYTSSSAGVEPRKTIVLQRNRHRPANGTATKPRQQAQAHGRSLRVKAAADIRVRPNQRCTVNWLGQTATGTIQNVAFAFPEATMDLLVNI